MHRLLAFAALLVVLGLPAASAATDLAPGGSFVDDDRNLHEGAIEALVGVGVTQGCASEPARFCPSAPVTREMMAGFLSRALGLDSVESPAAFVDDDGSEFEGEIAALAAAGVTTGCGEGLYCPARAVTRAEMASFLARAFVGEGSFDPPPNAFSDDDDSIHAPDIDRIAVLGITRGCGDGRYCPDTSVTRAEMASFLVRAMGIDEIPPPPRADARYLPGFTTYFACCESRVTNIHLMADRLNGMVVRPGEVFSMNERLGPRSEADGYVPAGILLDGESYCCDHPLNIGGGTSQVATTLYNAVFRNGFEILDHRPHSRYIDRYPLGIEATLGYPYPDVVFRNDTGTPLTIVTSHTATSVTVDLVGDVMGRVTSWRVDGSASYSGGGTVTVLRTVREADSTVRNQTWTWTYLRG